MLARQFAGVLGLVAFATVLARGMLRGSGLEPTLLAAWLSLWALAAVGWGVGLLAEFVLRESVRNTIAAELRVQEARQASAKERDRNRA